MKTRQKYILSIIAAWLLLFSVIFIASDYIFMSGFATLEQRLAIDNSKRIKRALLYSIKYLYFLNLDNAYWDDTYEYVNNRNLNYQQKNLSDAIFKDNKMQYVLILDKNKRVVWLKSYDLEKKQYQPFQREILDFFKKNASRLVTQKQKFNDLTNETHGVAGFLALPNTEDIAYFALNPIHDSDETKPLNGFLIFGKIITPKYEQELSQQLSYPINLIPLSTFKKTKGSEEVLKNLLAAKQEIYTVADNEQTMLSYMLIRDFNFNPIGVLQIKFSREIQNESRRSTHLNQLILLGFSILGIFSMSYLVYIFFKKQELITLAFERFVPHKLLQLLSKKSILDISLGDHSRRTVSVLFMDIRNFTTLSENMTPKENFVFINRILKKIAPIVTDNNGFIDKYIGDALMAIFTGTPNHADNAVQTAMGIIEAIDELNASGELEMDKPVQVGIGINTGESTLGIIGALGRMEGTVISDAVNLASRIESLTKSYGKSVLISKQCYEQILNPQKFTITYLDEVSVKGKSQKTKIYSVEKKSP